MIDGFVVDNMVIGQLAQLHDRFASWQWPIGLLKTAAYVAEKEARGDGRREQCLSQPWLEALPSPAGGQAARFVSTEIAPSGATPVIDAGEIACIGLAHATGYRFVTQERRGYLVAAAALGSFQVMLPYDLWLELESRGCLTADDRCRLSALTWRNHQQLVLRQPSRTV